MNHIHQLNRRRWAALALLLLLLVTGACGSDSGSDAEDGSEPEGEAASAPSDAGCASGTISGAGSTFVQTIVQQWIKDFSARCPEATVNYQGVGSGAGIQQFTSGTVDFAGSDVPLKPEEQVAAEAKHGSVVHIPWSAGGIAVEYNLPGIDDLKLTGEAVAGIFAGKVTRWDDPVIAGSNTGTRLPATPIRVVHRSDGSGTTAAFTEYLTKAAPSVWTAGSGKDVKWPTGEGAKGSDGVTAAVKQAAGAIGYAELSFAEGAGLGVAKIANASGAFVGPEGDAVAAALTSAEVPADLKMKIDYAPKTAGAYPISTATYVIVPQSPADSAKAKLIRAFVTYALQDGQDSAKTLYYAPLPESLVDKAVTVADSIGF